MEPAWGDEYVRGVLEWWWQIRFAFFQTGHCTLETASSEQWFA
jgi:hypothetical protein